jgi:Tfp pilus assembly major pilin PilA
VVIVIIAILAAIAVPLYVRQETRARVAAGQSDVSGLGREVAAQLVKGLPSAVRIGYTPYTDGGVDAVQTVRYTISPDGGTTWEELGRSSHNIYLLDTTGAVQGKDANESGTWGGVRLVLHDPGASPGVALTTHNWCLAVGVHVGSGPEEPWRFSARAGLEQGECGDYT